MFYMGFQDFAIPVGGRKIHVDQILPVPIRHLPKAMRASNRTVPVVHFLGIDLEIIPAISTTHFDVKQNIPPLCTVLPTENYTRQAVGGGIDRMVIFVYQLGK